MPTRGRQFDQHALIRIFKNPLSACQADNDGSIPFTRSNDFKGFSPPRVTLVSVKVSVSRITDTCKHIPASLLNTTSTVRPSTLALRAGFDYCISNQHYEEQRMKCSGNSSCSCRLA